jgi:hypothetical protein
MNTPTPDDSVRSSRRYSIDHSSKTAKAPSGLRTEVTAHKKHLRSPLAHSHKTNEGPSPKRLRHTSEEEEGKDSTLDHRIGTIAGQLWPGRWRAARAAATAAAWLPAESAAITPASPSSGAVSPRSSVGGEQCATRALSSPEERALEGRVSTLSAGLWPAGWRAARADKRGTSPGNPDTTENAPAGRPALAAAASEATATGFCGFSEGKEAAFERSISALSQKLWPAAWRSPRAAAIATGAPGN